MTQIIKLKNVSKTIGTKEILHNISFSIARGEVFGFIGPNGAGKTTTLKTILGILTPTEGEVKIFGRTPTDRDVQKRIGFMPENTYLYKYLTGDEFLNFCGGFYRMNSGLLQKRKEDLLERVGLTEFQHARLSTYSKGMLQRIGIAQALLHDPDIIFLDEPMSGLDPLGRKMIKDLLFSLKQEKKTVFFNSHILSDVEVICDRFAIITRGKIVAEESIHSLSGTLEDFFLEKVNEE